jgi:hypothetical protein
MGLIHFRPQSFTLHPMMRTTESPSPMSVGSVSPNVLTSTTAVLRMGQEGIVSSLLLKQIVVVACSRVIRSTRTVTSTVTGNMYVFHFGFLRRNRNVLYAYAFILHVLTILKRQNSSRRILPLATVVSICSVPIVKVA